MHFRERRLRALRDACIALPMLLIAAHGIVAQIASTPQLGISDFSVYQHNDIDSVNLSTGNVNVHIPLVSFPQVGNKLKMNFIIRYNAPQWTAYATNVGTVWNTGTPLYFGLWALNSDNQTPVGVDVVRDQGVTFNNQYLNYMCVANDGTGPADCNGGETEYYIESLWGDIGTYFTSAIASSVRDRTGASHMLGMSSTTGGVVGSAGGIAMVAADGSGWKPTGIVGPTQYFSLLDRDGIAYTPQLFPRSDGITYDYGYNLKDPNGNMISTTTTGWIDSVGRNIPGTYTGPGANPGNDLEDDPVPGVPSTDLSKCAAGTSAARTWAVPSVNGSSQTFTLCYQNWQSAPNFQVNTINGYTATLNNVNTTALLLTEVVLPNSSSYTFAYDNYMDLTSITLPTGGKVSYTWATIPWDPVSLSQPVTRAVSSRTVTSTSGVSNTWYYTWTTNSPGTPALQGRPTVDPGNVNVQVDVHKPDGNDEDHWTYSVFAGGSIIAKYYQGASPLDPMAAPSPSYKLLRTEVTQNQIYTSPYWEPLPMGPAIYNGDTPEEGIYTAPWSFQDKYIGQPISKTITLDDGSVSQEVYTPVPAVSISYANFGYNRGFENDQTRIMGTCLCLNYGLNSSTAEYDYGSGAPGSLLKTTTTNYKWNDGSSTAASYFAANLLDLPSSVVVTSPTGAWAAETDYAYDQSPSPSGALGNLTATTHVNSQGASPVNQTQFNNQGMPYLWIDPNGNQTAVTAFQCGGLFPNTVVRPYQSSNTVPETSTYSYDCTLGKLNSFTDPNGNTTTYSYNDPLARVTGANYPDGGSTQITYNDTPLAVSVTETTATGSTTPPIVNTFLYDGLGRTTQTQLNSDPTSTIYQDTTYDPVGRISSKSNPYRTQADATYGITTYAYDGLGRKTYQCQPDNGNSAPYFCQPGTSYLQWLYSGNTMFSYDETRRYRNAASDSLGRLTSIFEQDGTTNVASTPILETDYTYDPLDNLLSVTQKGLSTETPRIRSFTYDSLSRLLCASNPENSENACPISSSSGIPSNVTSYQYYPNGNILSKTDARGVSTNYFYDGLNRIVTKTYSGTGTAGAIASNTPPSTFTYSSPSVLNGIGHMATAYTGLSTSPLTQTSVTAYDKMGRLVQETQCLVIAGCSGTPYSFQYQYDWTGKEIYSNNGVPNMGIGLTYGYDAAGRLSGLASTWSDATHPESLFGAPNAGAQYGPAGLIAASLGTQSGSSQPIYVQTKAYDNRFRTIAETDQENQLAPIPATSSTGSITISGAEQSTTSQGVHGTGTISITGTEHSHTVCTTIRIGSRTITQCNPVADTGTLVVTVGGFQATATYVSGSTDASVAASLASALTGGSSPVSATSSGNVVTITSLATGSASNYPFSITNGTDFMGADSGSTLTGGAAGGLVYDAGTVSVSIGGYTPSYTWTSSDTANSIASGLAAAIASADSGVQTSVSGSTINLTSVQAGASGNTSIGCSVSYNSAQFTSASFSAGCSGMSGGANAALSGSPSTGSISVNTLATLPISGSFTIGGQEGTDYLQSYDYGMVNLYVGNASVGVQYGQNSTPEGLAAQLAASLNGYSYIKATVVYGSTINIVANLPISQMGSFYGNAPSGDLQMIGTSFTVGTVGPAINDSGSVKVTINGVTTAPVTWSPGTTAQQITSNLVTAINVADGGFLTATLGSNGTTVNLTSTASGSNTDWPIQVTDSDTSGINPPAYSFTASNMSGGSGANNAVIYSYSIPLSGGYDTNGNLLNVSDSVMGSWSYEYDNLNRLTQATVGSGMYMGTNIAGTNLGWAYDSFGNRWVQSSTNPVLPSGSVQFSGANNRAMGIGLASYPNISTTTFQYDAAGEPTGSNGNQMSAFDAEGRLCATSNNGTGGYTQYIYDAEGQRVAKGTANDLSCSTTGNNGFALTNQYLLGSSGEEVSELDGRGNWMLSNVYAAGKLLATYNPSGLYFHFSDWLGSRRAQASATGILEDCQSLPFGDGLACTGADATPLHFTGKERDAESGLDYFGARYLGSNMGRWMSPDPAGIGYADAENPQSLNLYAYVNNNPLSFVDPNGMLACGSGGAEPTATRGGAAGAVGSFFRAIGCALQGAASAVGNALSSTVQAAGTSAPPGSAQAAPSNFQQLWNNYPSYSQYPSQSTSGQTTFWQHAGGHVEQNAGVFVNSCSLRMCYALNRSGYPIPHGPGTTSDAAHNWNIPRLTDLQPFLIKNFGKPQQYSPNSWRKQLAGQTGILMFQVNIWSDATGHATLWNGSELRDGGEHDYTDKSSGVLFWPVH